MSQRGSGSAEPRGTQPAQPAAEQPPASYAGRTHFTELEYEAILANASLGIAFTRQRKFFLCNPKFGEMLGWNAAELIGQPGDIVYASRESYEALGRIAEPILSSGSQLDVEWDVRRKDGSVFPCRMIAKAIDPKDPGQGTIWIAEDITQKKRQAEELAHLLREHEAILDTAPIGMSFIRARRIVRCNRRFEQMHGYASGELIGRSTRIQYATDQDYRQIGDAYAELARGLTATREVRCARNNGVEFWARLTGRYADPNDPDKGSVWVVEDITAQHEAEARVRRALDEQQLILDNATVGIAFVRERVIQRASRRLEQMAGVGPGELVGRSTRDLYASQEEWDQAGRTIYRQVGVEGIYAGERRFARIDGTTFLCRMQGRRISRGEEYGEWIWSYEDITFEREAEAKVQRVLAEQELILDNATVGIAFVRHRIFQRCNPRCEEMFGYPPGGFTGQSAAVLFDSAEEFERQGDEAYEVLLSGDTFVREQELGRRDGSRFWCKVIGRAIDPARPQDGSIWIYEDVSAEHAVREALVASRDALERAVAERTEELLEANERLETEIAERREAEQRAQHLADHDALTGLPNRRLLEDRLTQALAHSARTRRSIAVMFIDLDRFKTVNDSLGHAVGDELLKQIARRLVELMRFGDTVCRIGGDEFVLVLQDIKSSQDAALVAQKVIAQLSAPIRTDGQEFTITPSIGISISPGDGRDAETMIRNADAAMYHAKEMGRANYQFFTRQMNLAASRRLTLENDLRRALQRDELRLYYQPIAEIGTRRIVGHEALVRWQHPEKGLVLPAEFIQLAEETGLILPIGAWVLHSACRWATFIGVEHGLPVAVNLSARQFNDPRLVETVAAALDESGLPASLLELEITESTAMQHTDETLATLKALKDLGVSLVIDDFGTGYSSLLYLKRFPVDKLKIDGSFIAEVPTDPDHCAIVAAVIALGRALKLAVVAEGIENEAQIEFLRLNHCGYMQGNVIGPPVDADAAARDFI